MVLRTCLPVGTCKWLFKTTKSVSVLSPSLFQKKGWCFSILLLVMGPYRLIPSYSIYITLEYHMDSWVHIVTRRWHAMYCWYYSLDLTIFPYCIRRRSIRILSHKLHCGFNCTVMLYATLAQVWVQVKHQAPSHQWTHHQQRLDNRGL